MMPTPLVSVIMPVFNGAPFLAQAIENIQQQDYAPLEIIIIDDGSTDETATVAAQFADLARYVYQPNAGPGAARNHALQLALGEIITFLDVDDLWATQKLQREVKYLIAHPQVGIVQGLIQDMVLSEGEGTNFTPSGTPYSFINLGSACYRRSVFQQVGLFDDTIGTSDDTDWFIRAWEQGITKVILDDISLYYRKHTSNVTNGVSLKQTGFVRLFKKHLDRHRAQNGPTPAISMTDYIGWNNLQRRKVI